MVICWKCLWACEGTSGQEKAERGRSFLQIRSYDEIRPYACTILGQLYFFRIRVLTLYPEAEKEKILSDKHPENKLLARLTGRGIPPWFENVLVVKQLAIPGNSSAIVDLDMTEAAFVANYLRERSCFFAFARKTEAGINGSVRTLTLDWRIPVPALQAPMVKNLNVVVPVGTDKVWCTFIERVLKNVRWVRQPVSPEYQHVASKVVTFSLSHNDHLQITVTTSRTTSILPVVLAAGCTFQQNLLTSTRIICPHVKSSNNGRALLGWASAVSGTPVARIHKPFVHHPLYGFVQTDDSTVAWDEPCGFTCPGVNRQVYGLKGFGVPAWGGNGGNFDRDGGTEWTVNVYEQDRFQVEDWVYEKVVAFQPYQYIPVDADGSLDAQRCVFKVVR
ncbi:hypothetical protein DFH09DRAFT_1289186 [Mycena vulgaris]|nr:hypothetical protein DFH09DRAFT_1289186 [Mycena vulgaris]